MELTEELKKELSNCGSREEAKNKLKEKGIVLSDEEMDAVAGGVGGIILTQPRKKH